MPKIMHTISSHERRFGVGDYFESLNRDKIVFEEYTDRVTNLDDCWRMIHLTAGPGAFKGGIFTPPVYGSNTRKRRLHQVSNVILVGIHDIPRRNRAQHHATHCQLDSLAGSLDLTFVKVLRN
ncbi:unnamed protein product [Somion occarium]|uniref:Uncharacterized protein n=1 Tax=Somion occarium TaxID=3059160 RepID=A0ABP1DLM9_9APHY